MQTRIRNAARTTGRRSFITEADVFSNPDTFKDADPNVAAHLNSFLAQELQPKPPAAIRDDRGAQHAALWLLTQDLLGGNPQPTATRCEDLRFPPTHTVPQETQWHMAYLTNGTPCRWFTDLWQRP